MTQTLEVLVGQPVGIQQLQGQDQLLRRREHPRLFVADRREKQTATLGAKVHPAANRDSY